MTFDWPAETAADFEAYFARFLIPANIALCVNGRTLPSRQPVHKVPAQLPTEIYNATTHVWHKPRKSTVIELVKTAAGEDACIYEMGIPVAAAEWSAPYHANVQQRIPMNPNRDALASGYARKVHTASLATLLEELDRETLTQDWAGAAGLDADPEVQKTLIVRAFGANAVRAVPVMGKRDFNDDATRFGTKVIKTNQLSGGFREMAKLHLPTARDTVTTEQRRLCEEIASTGFTTDDVGKQAADKQTWIKRRGGRARVDRCLAFAVWLRDQLVKAVDLAAPPVTGALALGQTPVQLGMVKGKFLAHWSSQNCLTLALECDGFWIDPLGAEALSILVHEAAHARNAHHGKSFHDELEKLAGIAAALMFRQADAIRQRWHDLQHALHTARQSNSRKSQMTVTMIMVLQRRMA